MGEWRQPDGRLVLPVDLGLRLIQEAHGPSHHGKSIVVDKIREQRFCPNLKELVAQYVRDCKVCGSHNQGGRPYECPRGNSL